MLTKSEFAQQVRQALENLHDFVYLQKLALLAALYEDSKTLDQSVRQFRSALLDAIEAVKSPDSLSPRAKERRPYAILYGRYVQGMGTADLVGELGISVRQLRRENKRALKAVTDLLWDLFEDRLYPGQALSGTDQVPGRHEAAQMEAKQLISQARVEELDLRPLVNDILSVMAPVVAQNSTTLHVQMPADLPLMRGDRIILRQSLFELFSYAIGHAMEGEVLIRAGAGQAIGLKVDARGKTPAKARAGVSLNICRQLIASLGGRVAITDTGRNWEATVSLPRIEDISLLIMDDNPGLVALFRRYLSGHNYRPLVAQSAEQAIEIARNECLRLIILDVMMPEQDGWEILQRLRAAPVTQHTPILICSVLDEPQIAYTLGASDYLTKPVTQHDLLTKVEQWCHSR